MKRHFFPLAITATLAALVLTACGDDEPTGADDPASTSETSDATTEPTDATTTADSEPTSPDTTDAAPETVKVSVFFVGDTPHGPALFAEQREVEADNPAGEALALLMAGDTNDPDYRSLVPADSLSTDVSFDGAGDDGFYSIALADAKWARRPAGTSAVEAKLAVQQIVFTLLAQAGSGGDPGVNGGVGFHDDSSDIGFLGSDVVVRAADDLNVRALVNVLAPAEGAAVSGSFTASGEASSFEATVPWQVRDESGETVLNGFATAEGWIDGLYPWETEVDVSSLDPGTYTFVAMTDDPSGGAEGAGPTEDTKTIVVE